MEVIMTSGERVKQIKLSAAHHSDINSPEVCGSDILPHKVNINENVAKFLYFFYTVA